ncbi:unnamed protein product [Phaedon cochleariae]|uniref:Endonuclease-reverse transcriptase n=1 Tax=Phaedon cochleariae TaxID=80249 RepID=A0A9N9X2L9_PHACE|nr:unnamed protein product [Phaedon cochleariae]
MGDKTIESLFARIDQLEANLDKKVEKAQSTIDSLISEIQHSNKKIQELEQENSILKIKVNRLEQKGRKNNIIVSGLKQEEGTENNLSKLQQVLEVNIEKGDLNDIYYLGGKEDKSKLLKIEFNCYWKKQEILRNCYKLKNQGIFINQDLTKEEQEVHKKLRIHLNKAKSQGRKATIRNSLLIVDSVVYTYQQLSADPEFSFSNQQQENNSTNSFLPETQEEGSSSSKRNGNSPNPSDQRKKRPKRH